MKPGSTDLGLYCARRWQMKDNVAKLGRWLKNYENQSDLACLTVLAISVVLWAASGLPQNAPTTLAAVGTILVVPLIYGALALGFALACMIIAGFYAWGRLFCWLGRWMARALLARFCAA